jgi:hypothetical protein
LPPAIDDLPPVALGLARQWPAGAYAAHGELFRAYWLGEGRQGARKLDWVQTWCNWIGKVTAQVLRDAKAGVVFVAPSVMSRSSVEVVSVSSRKGEECPRSKAIHDKLYLSMGPRSYAHWIKPCAIVIGRKAVEISSPSAFMLQWVRQHNEGEIEAAARAVMGANYQSLRFMPDPAPN